MTICALLRDGIAVNLIIADPDRDEPPEKGMTLAAIPEDLPVGRGWLLTRDGWRLPDGSVYVEPPPPWEPTPDETVNAIMGIAKVRRGDVFYDLGCGDGRVCLAAMARGARAVGIDVNPRVVAPVFEFRTQDVLDADFSDATVVYLWLGERLTKALAPKLSTLRRGTRIVMHQHAFDREFRGAVGDLVMRVI